MKEKIKNLFKKPWFYLGIVIVVFLGFVAFMASIYFYNPAFIPSEFKKKTREVIDEDILGALKGIAPNLVENIQSKKFQEETPTSTTPSSSTPSTTPVENWPIYRNEKYGYEVRYPEGWKIYDERDSITIFTKESDIEQLKKDKIMYKNTDVPFMSGKTILLITHENQKEITLNQYLDNIFGNIGVTKERKIINGLEGFYIVDKGPNRFGGGTGYYYFTQDPNKKIFYELGIDFFLNQEIDQKLVQKLDLVANTFRIK